MLQNGAVPQSSLVVPSHFGTSQHISTHLNTSWDSVPAAQCPETSPPRRCADIPALVAPCRSASGDPHDDMDDMAIAAPLGTPGPPLIGEHICRSFATQSILMLCKLRVNFVHGGTLEIPRDKALLLSSA